MKRILKSVRFFLVLAVCLSLWVASIATASQSAVGAYLAKSPATAANTQYQPSRTTNRLLAVGTVIARQFVVVAQIGNLVVGYYTGDPTGNQSATTKYERMDFSKFD